MTDPFSDNDFRGALALLADAAPEPAATDLVAAQAAWAVAHRPAWPVRTMRGVAAAVRRTLRTRPWVAWPVLAAAAAAVVLLAVALAPSVRLSAPQPAAPPAGPGALPERLYVAPEWTPSVTAAPIPRAAYLVDVRNPRGSGPGRELLVGADGGTYRRLPGPTSAATLSPDGRRVAWAAGQPGTGPSIAVVEVLDLPTGRVRSVRVPSVYGVQTSVDGLVFDAAGTRLALWGQDSADGAVSRGIVRVLGLGEVGSDQPLRTIDGCRCGGPVTWLDDGRLGYEPQYAASGVFEDLEDVATAALPPAPVEGDATSLGGVGPALLVDGSGTTRYAVASRLPSEQDVFSTEPYRLVAATADGTASERSLGEAADAVGLAVLGDVVYLARRGPAPATGTVDDGPLTIEAVRPAGRTTLTTADAGVTVRQVARDVAAGGRVAATPAPVFGPGTLVWWAWHVRTPLAVLGAAAGVAAGLWLLVRVATRPWRRWLSRLRPTRHGLWVVGVTCSLATGLAFLLSPAVVEAAWTASAPRPAADAPAVVPQVLLDQRVRPPRAFDVADAPRTTRLTVAFSGTVAGRAGVYGLDAGTGRVVRLDDLPGVPRTWSVNGAYALALSPSGRRVALWTDNVSDRRVAVVDLAAARVVVRSDVVHDDAGSAAGIPWSPLLVDDDGTLRPVADGVVDAAVNRFGGTGVLAAQTAPGGATAGVVRTTDGWQVRGGSGGDPSAQVTSRLPVEGRIVVAAGAVADVGAQVPFGALPEPWWTALGERSKQPVGWLFLTLAALLVLPAAGRRVRAWPIMGRGLAGGFHPREPLPTWKE